MKALTKQFPVLTVKNIAVITIALFALFFFYSMTSAQGSRSVSCEPNQPIYGNTYSLGAPEGGVTCTEGSSGGGGGGGVRTFNPPTTTPPPPPPGGSGLGFRNVIQIDNDADHSSIFASRTDESPVLAGGGTDMARASYAFPSAGTWYLRACADDLDTVREGLENNNCGPWNTITVTAPEAARLPDLTASDIEAIAVQNSLNVILNTTISNIGEARAGN